MARLLKEQIDSPHLELIESTNGALIVRGEFGSSKEATQNKRLYKKPIWESNIKRLESQFPNRNVYGETDHPSDGKTSLRRVSHIITHLELRDDGVVFGEAEILPTSSGKDLAVLFRNKCKVGISSRGYGSTKSLPDGLEEVQEDYKLMTFDFVADPADRNAYPSLSEDVHSVTDSGQLLFEGAEFNEVEDLEDLDEDDTAYDDDNDADLDDLDEDSDEMEDLVKSAVPAIDAAVDAAYQQIVADAREDLLSEDTEERLQAFDSCYAVFRKFFNESDEVATLREQNKALQIENKRLLAETDELEQLARSAGMVAWLEKQIANTPVEESVRARVGDVFSYDSVPAFQARVEQILNGLVEEQQELSDRDSTIQDLKDRTRKLEKSLEKAQKELEESVATSMIRERAPHRPRGQELLEAAESTPPKTIRDARKLLEEARPRKRSRLLQEEPTTPDVVSRIRASLGVRNPDDSSRVGPRRRVDDGAPSYDEIRPFLRR